MCFGVFANGLNQQSITDQNKKRMTAIIKMFFIMGITWLAEIVSFSIDFLAMDVETTQVWLLLRTTVAPCIPEIYQETVHET